VEGVGWFRVLAPSPTILSFQTGCDVLALKSGACDLWTIEWRHRKRLPLGFHGLIAGHLRKAVAFIFSYGLLSRHQRNLAPDHDFQTQLWIHPQWGMGSLVT
jgi:hypothetical protein